MLSYLARRSLSTSTRAPAYAKATGELRETFLGYFEKQGHTRVASSGLVPGDDPTILFTNAGMNQFKDQMAGLVEPTHVRATSAQKCVRAGGKHNDLDNVGFTNRHHTFFEMMGNFSLGAYSREEAIVYAWRFLTEELGLPRDQLGVTVHHLDSESLALWEKVAGLSLSSSPGRMRLLGDEDNFWAMGPTGPCGVCSEIFWDQGSHIVDPEERWLEVWNLVFMDSLRAADGSLTPLARPCIDTGMGLERMASVLQGVPSNYEIDSMAVLMNSARELVTTRTTPGGTNAVLHTKGGNDFRVLTPAVVALRVMTDHVRAAAFLISEGVFPSNVGRGYVVRRIIRRAVRYAASLGIQGSCLASLLPTLRATMGDAYPQLVTGGDTGIDISAVLTGEEDLFHRTLDRGLKHLHSSCSGAGAGVSADLTFMLWDSYGFPLDITTAIAKEEGWTVDEKGFHELMAVQKERSRAATTFAAFDTTQWVPPEVYEWSSNLFTGYEMTSHAARIQARAEVGKNEAWLQLDRCPFYAESGGQASDQGYLMVAGRRHAVQEVMRTPAGALVLRVSDRHGLAVRYLEVEAVVDAEARARTAAHHTATHLVHAALKAILPAPQGQVAQAGSSVDAERLRFDFTFQGKLTPEVRAGTTLAHHIAVSMHSILIFPFLQLVAEVEAWVNKYCAEKLAVSTSVKSLQEARARGATALFGEKYGEEVRVVEIGDISQVHVCISSTHC
jgi:alanyl-tRNA synthetase